jgi:hypothetical protein
MQVLQRNMIALSRIPVYRVKDRHACCGRHPKDRLRARRQGEPGCRGHPFGRPPIEIGAVADFDSLRLPQSGDLTAVGPVQGLS